MWFAVINIRAKETSKGSSSRGRGFQAKEYCQCPCYSSLHKPREANLERWKYLGQFLGLKGTAIKLTPSCLESSPFHDIQIKSNKPILASSHPVGKVKWHDRNSWYSLTSGKQEAVNMALSKHEGASGKAQEREQVLVLSDCGEGGGKVWSDMRASLMCPPIWTTAEQRGRKSASQADKCARLSSFFTIKTGSRLQEVHNQCQKMMVTIRQVRSLLTELEMRMFRRKYSVNNKVPENGACAVTW